MQTDIHIEELPSPLAQVVRRQREETQPFRRIHRLIDTVEVLVKLHTVVIVSELFAGRGDLSPELRGMLASGLRTPSLGIWWAFAREFGKARPECDGIIRAFHEAVSHKKSRLKKAMDGEDNLITFRNAYAHGATPSDAACEEDLQRMEPRVLALAADAAYLRDCEWIAVDTEGRALRTQGEASKPYTGELPPPGEAGCYLRLDDGWLSLDPLLTRQETENRFFFYNDLRKQNRAGLLNYENACHVQDTEAGERLLRRYPIHEWIKTAPEDFRQRMEELTETFKGRREELEQLRAFPRAARGGFLMLWGGPGIGKSALLARLTQLLRLPEALRETKEDSPSPDPGGRFEVLEYFIRRGINQTDRIETLLDNLSQRLERIGLTGIPLGGTAQEKALNFQRRLRTLQDREFQGEARLILVIDGLDEASTEHEFFDWLPKEVPANVFILYSSRPVPRVRERVYECLDREARREVDLQGLSPGDIRAILSDSVSKYELQAEYIETVTQRSGGNPLYLNLLCQGLVSGQFHLNDSTALPRSMKELYEQSLRRILRVPGAGDLLRLLATAHDSLTVSLMAAMLEQSADPLQAEALPACMELLSELPDSHSGLRYQLFHESLREYLRESFPREREDLEEKLYTWCMDWDRKRKEERLYGFQHLPAHARACCQRWKNEDAAALRENLERIEGLLASDAFRQKLFEGLHHCRPYQELCRLLLRHTPETEPTTERPRRAARHLCNLHQEPERRYRETLKQLDSLSTTEMDLNRLLRISEGGSSPAQKILLLLRGLKSPCPVPCPESVTHQVQAWCEAARDPDLQLLCQSFHLIPKAKS